MKMLEYTEVKISDLAMNENNPRVNDKAAEKLTKGIEKYGFINPVVVNRQGNMILAGHTRVKALKNLGKKTVPVLFVDMDEATARGFAIWDNKSAEFSEWDKDLLDLEIQELVDLDFNIELTGFSLEDFGVFNPDGGEMPEMPNGDKAPIQQLTFTLHDDQAEIVKAAIQKAKGAGPFVDTGNENSNGNALARIAEAYCG